MDDPEIAIKSVALGKCAFFAAGGVRYDAVVRQNMSFCNTVGSSAI
jgi:hypothetical protein